MSTHKTSTTVTTKLPRTNAFTGSRMKSGPMRAVKRLEASSTRMATTVSAIASTATVTSPIPERTSAALGLDQSWMSPTEPGRPPNSMNQSRA